MKTSDDTKTVIPGVTDTPSRKMMNAIMAEVYTACENLGADSNLLSILGSFGDTQADEDILVFLKDQNRGS